MKALWSILVFFLEATTFAQLVLPPPDESRVLCVIDTSYSMRLEAAGTVGSIRGLIASGFDGFLDPGQQFSLWSFNDDVFRSTFFPRAWNPNESGPEIETATRFIEHQPFQKQTRFDRLIPEIKKFARTKESLLVLIFSDGEDKIYGTPFDNVVNDWIKSVGREARKTKTPIIILLVASRGGFVSWNVQPASKPLWFPEGAKLPQAPPPPPSKPVEAVVSPPVPPPPAVSPAPIDDPALAAAALQREIPGVIVNPKRPPPPEVVTNTPVIETTELAATNSPARSDQATISPSPNPPPTNDIGAAIPPEEPVLPRHRTKPVAANPADPAGQPWAILIGGGALLVLLFSINAFLRSRDENRASLITRALKK